MRDFLISVLQALCGYATIIISFIIPVCFVGAIAAVIVGNTGRGVALLIASFMWTAVLLGVGKVLMVLQEQE